MRRVADSHGKGAVGNYASSLAANLHGFEHLVGAYAVSELRVSRLLQQRGAVGERANIYLTDTLESPHATPRQLPLFMQPISEQRQLALESQAAHADDRLPRQSALRSPRSRKDATTATARALGCAGAMTAAAVDAVFQDFAAPVAAAGVGAAS